MVLFILFVVYFIYNGLQVIKALGGNRFENPAILFFFACFIDLFAWVRSKF